MTTGRWNASFSRRRFLQGAAAGTGGLALSGLLPSLPAGAQDKTLEMWWWGEQELPGLQAFVDDSVAAYKEAAVKTMLQDTAVVISQFQTAAAAGKAPDIQFLWNGIYHMESVWLGYLRGLDGLVSPEVIKASNPTLLSTYGGNVYRVGWYPIPMLWYYNKDLFDKAKLNADAPPKTWDEMLAACEALKGIGVAPVGGGIQDGYWGEWYLGQALPQNLDTVGEALDLFIGERDFRDPKYYALWTKLEELKKAGFLNDDMSSTELYPGIDMLVAGKIGMGESVGTRLPADSKTTGGKIGVMVMPVYGTGKLAGQPIMDTQGFGISTDSKDPEAAAAFLEFLHSPDRLKAFWDKTGWIPSDTNFDTSVVTDPAVKGMWQDWALSPNIPYVANLTPGQFYEQAMIPAAQKVIEGTMTGEQAGELAASVAQEWRDFNPDLLEKYKSWAKDLA